MRKGSPKLFVCIGLQTVGVLEVQTAKADRSGLATIKTRVAQTFHIPHDVDASNARDLGSWLAASIEQAGCKSKSVTLVLERSDVVAKRLTLEGIERGDVDLPGMVRYQLMRQVAFHADDAPIDFKLLQPKVKSLKEVSGEAEVLAATAPATRVAHLRAVCEAAGLDVQRIAIFSLGLSEIAAAAMADRVGPTLVIAPTLDGIDYSIHQGGRVLSSRWIETQHRTVSDGLNDLIVSEARRTRMSHQLAPDSEPIHSALIIAEEGGVLGDLESLANTVGDVLGVITEPIDPRSQPWLKISGECESERLLGLIGLAAADAKENSGHGASARQIDLAHPVVAADRSAAKRQIVMAAILLMIVSLGGIKSMGNLKVAAIDSDIEAMKDSGREVEQTFHRVIREHAAGEFLYRWQEAGASPLEHINRVVDILPGNDSVLLRSIKWTADSFVDYPRQRGRTDYDPSNWQEGVLVSFGVEIAAKNRELADRIRQSFVEIPEYTASTSGPDGAGTNQPGYPEKLALSLKSRVARPVSDASRDDATAGEAP
ncbi:MAG: pilus assembly protein PilM [Phycisphaerales bacterium JB050]